MEVVYSCLGAICLSSFLLIVSSSDQKCVFALTWMWKNNVVVNIASLSVGIVVIFIENLLSQNYYRIVKFTRWFILSHCEREIVAGKKSRFVIQLFTIFFHFNFNFNFPVFAIYDWQAISDLWCRFFIFLVWNVKRARGIWLSVAQRTSHQSFEVRKQFMKCIM